MIGRERVKKGPYSFIFSSWQDAEYSEVVKRKIEFEEIADVTLSNLQVSQSVCKEIL